MPRATQNYAEATQHGESLWQYIHNRMHEDDVWRMCYPPDPIDVVLDYDYVYRGVLPSTEQIVTAIILHNRNHMV